MSNFFILRDENTDTTVSIPTELTEDEIAAAVEVWDRTSFETKHGTLDYNDDGCGNFGFTTSEIDVCDLSKVHEQIVKILGV